MGVLGTGEIGAIGKNDGEGFTLNVPLPLDCGDNVARMCFEEIVGPAAERFQPDIILVSAGVYDLLAALSFLPRLYTKNCADSRYTEVLCARFCFIGVLGERCDVFWIVS